MKENIKFEDIYLSFDLNMQALFILFDTIQNSVGEKEWSGLKDFYQEIYNLAPDEDPSELQSIMERLIQIDIEEDVVDYQKIWQTVQVDPHEVFNVENGKPVFVEHFYETLKEWAQRYPESANKFFRSVLKYKNSRPIKSELARQGLLLSAVGQLEFLLLHLLRVYIIHSQRENPIPEEIEIEELDSLISQQFFGKERHRFITMREKMVFLDSKFPLIEFTRNKLDEIIEKRNVFTHRSGRADNSYHKKNPNVKPGDQLRISRNYLIKTIEYIHLYGLVLCQRIWRKYGDILKAEKELTESILHLVRDRRYELGCRLCELIQKNNINFSTSNQETFLINYAICLDKAGNHIQKRKILGRIRTEPRQSEYTLKKAQLDISNDPMRYRVQMGYQALSGNIEHALDFLEKAVDCGEISYWDLDRWVIFDYFKDEPRFQRVVQRLEAMTKFV